MEAQKVQSQVKTVEANLVFFQKQNLRMFLQAVGMKKTFYNLANMILKNIIQKDFKNK
jgi:hypothetical protein